MWEKWVVFVVVVQLLEERRGGGVSVCESVGRGVFGRVWGWGGFLLR